MSPLITFITQAMRKASRFLIRDYLELEYLQNSRKNTVNFVQSSHHKLYESLCYGLKRYPNSEVSDNELILKQNHAISFIVKPIDGIANLQKALPTFGTIILCYEHKNNETSLLATVLNFPVLGEIAYATRGGGAWNEKTQDYSTQKASRLRVSTISNKDQAIYATDSVKHFNDRSRAFHCDSYSGYLVATGKIDIFISDKIDFVTKTAISLLVIEAGGKIDSSNHTTFIATNNSMIL